MFSEKSERIPVIIVKIVAGILRTFAPSNIKTYNNMKKMMIFAVLVIVSMTAFAQVSKEEQELIDLSNQKWQWMAEKNADRLSELFLENAQFVHMGGYWGKAQELQIIRSGGIWYKHAEVHSQEVKFAGSTATVYSRIHLTAAVGGNEVVNPFIVSEVFVMEDGKWRLSLLAFTRTIGE